MQYQNGGVCLKKNKRKLQTLITINQICLEWVEGHGKIKSVDNFTRHQAVNN